MHKWLNDCDVFILQRGFWYTSEQLPGGSYVTAVMDATQYMESQQVLLDAGDTKAELLHNIRASIAKFGLED